MSRLLSVLGIALLIACATQASNPVDFGRAFEDANRLYEQGRFGEAAMAYEQLLGAGHRPTAVYYNLGNAWFKAGQNGKAIAAYRQAERLNPREPNLRFNLQFVRKRVTGDERDHRPPWQRFFGNLTLNEWTLLVLAPYWVCCGLLAVREIRPGLKRVLRPYAVIAGTATLLLAGWVASAAYATSNTHDAIVVVSRAVVRRSPLDEAAVSYQLPDGAEVTVLDRKESMAGDRKQIWLQVRDQQGIGWLQSDQVILLKPA